MFFVGSFCLIRGSVRQNFAECSFLTILEILANHLVLVTLLFQR